MVKKGVTNKVLKSKNTYKIEFVKMTRHYRLVADNIYLLVNLDRCTLGVYYVVVYQKRKNKEVVHYNKIKVDESGRTYGWYLI